MMGRRIYLATCLWFCCNPVLADFTTIINVPPQTAPSSIGSDTQLNLSTGGSTPTNFTVGAVNGSSTNMEVNITGGTVNAFFLVYGAATINVSGGNIGNRFWLHEGSTANVTGGTFGPNVLAEQGAVFNILGGDFNNEVHALFRSEFNVWGGNINFFQAHEESEVNFYGKEFFLDGVEMTGLVPGEPFMIDDRDVSFSGTLADGSTFDFDLISEHPVQSGPDVDHFAHEAILMVTLLPTADFNLDTDVNGADLAVWNAAYGVNDSADADGDGDSDGADFLAWQSQYSEPVGGFVGAVAVPEPAAVALFLIAGVCGIALNSRR